MTAITAGVEPVKQDITIWQGKTASIVITFAKSGAAWPAGVITAAAQIRDTDYSVLLASFACSVVSTATEHTVTLTIDAETTAAIPAGKGKWDLEICRTSDGYKPPTYYGDVTIKPEATK